MLREIGDTSCDPVSQFGFAKAAKAGNESLSNLFRASCGLISPKTAKTEKLKLSKGRDHMTGLSATKKLLLAHQAFWGPGWRECARRSPDG